MGKLLKYMENTNEFKNDLDIISKTWDQLILLSQLGSSNIDMSQTKENFTNLTNELILNLTDETLDKVIHEMNAKSQVTVDIVIRNLFERTADIGFLATDDDIRKFLKDQITLKQQLKLHVNDEDDTKYRIANAESKKQKKNIQARFEEYVNKYSVYYDVVLFDSIGNIVATLDDTKDISKTTDIILELAKDTNDDFIETYKYHDFLPSHDKSLVYTFKITNTNEDNSILGYLSLCFKFENEMKDIFSNLINKENKEVLLLLDSNNEVIATSDKYHIPTGAVIETSLIEDYKIIQFAGRDYICKTCKTNGYEGFYGLGWVGHIMIPIDSAFEEQEYEMNIEEDMLNSVMQNKKLFKQEFLDIRIKANHIQTQLDRAVWNGNVTQRSAKDKNNFERSILREVRLTGVKTKEIFNTSIEKLNYTIISSLLENASFLSSLAINIMDRNLYERANDVRWWSLTSRFKKILEKEFLDENDRNNMTETLTHINKLYTVYTNLFIYDKDGEIIAISNQSETHLIGKKLNEEWKNSTLKLDDSSKYIVSSFEKTHLFRNQETYIYNAAIKDTKNSKNIGGIGIVFDSTPQFKDILYDTLPKADGNVNSDIFGLFVDKKTKTIISSSNNKHSVGDILDIDSSLFDLDNGNTISKTIKYQNKYYFIGVTCSFGYREYKSENDDYINDVLSFIFIEAGDANHEPINIKTQENNFDVYQTNENIESKDIATFYIADKWLGVEQNDIVEAISIDELESSINMDSTHHFKGTVIYKGVAVSILDIGVFIKQEQLSNSKEIVIINYQGAETKHRIGIIVDRLGEILHVPNEYIKPFEEHLIGGGTLIESIVQPPKSSASRSLLTLLNIAKLNNIKSN